MKPNLRMAELSMQCLSPQNGVPVHNYAPCHKSIWEVEVEVQAFSTSALDGSSEIHDPAVLPPVTHPTGGKLAHRADIDATGKIGIPAAVGKPQ
jgi:hypothetical protein